MIFVVIINTTFSNCSDIPILLKIFGEFGAVIRERKDQGENEGCKQMRLLGFK